mmetsp:Transcript_12084/g.29508  ORF Transcript_12084/g.29508 Transcript_12084/m.29508 type:complete len:228 (-) Transcript_12084:835-1518(-)
MGGGRQEAMLSFSAHGAFQHMLRRYSMLLCRPTTVFATTPNIIDASLIPRGGTVASLIWTRSCGLNISCPTTTPALLRNKLLQQSSSIILLVHTTGKVRPSKTRTKVSTKCGPKVSQRVGHSSSEASKTILLAEEIGHIIATTCLGEKLLLRQCRHHRVPLIGCILEGTSKQIIIGKLLHQRVQIILGQVAYRCRGSRLAEHIHQIMTNPSILIEIAANANIVILQQ